jgi:nitrate/nitrite-specific signal transduction histidine kinase
MHTKIFAGAVISLSLLSLANAEISTLNEAINKAGKQRMLSQKMMKDYSMVGMNMKFNNPSKQLTESVALFDTTIDELTKFIKDKDASKTLAEVKTLWATIKPELTSSPKKEKALELFKKIDKLLELTNKATNLIVKSAKVSSGEIINISGKQRMLAQRLGSLYMLKVWSIGMDEEKLQSTIKEFASAQKKLEEFPKNTDAINSGLADVKKDFAFFEILGASKSKKYIPSLIARSSNKITNKMNTVTKLYVEIK